MRKCSCGHAVHPAACSECSCRAGTPRGGATKRASYRDGVAWIGENDGPGDADALSPAAVEQLISVALLADLFGKPTYQVAVDVVRYRGFKLKGRL